MTSKLYYVAKSSSSLQAVLYINKQFVKQKGSVLYTVMGTMNNIRRNN